MPAILATRSVAALRFCSRGSSYTTLLAASHTLEVGASFSTQAYSGGNLAALEAIGDGTRYVGSIHARDRWSPSRKATLDYGLHYAHYGYLEQDSLASPSMACRSRVKESKLYEFRGMELVAPTAWPRVRSRSVRLN